MANVIDEIYCLDVREIVTVTSKVISEALDKKQLELVPELLLIVEKIVNDLVTRLTHWSDNTIYIDTDNYLPRFDPKTTTISNFNSVYDEINKIIHRLEVEISSLDIFPTWGYATVKTVNCNIVIVIAGDYRIDDWMKQNSKRLRKEDNIMRLTKIEEE